MAYLEHMILAILEVVPDASVSVRRDPEAKSSRYTVTADLYVTGSDGTWRTGKRFAISHSFMRELAGDFGAEQGQRMAKQLLAARDAHLKGSE
jgi:hypothetical protein